MAANLMDDLFSEDATLEIEAEDNPFLMVATVNNTTTNTLPFGLATSAPSHFNFNIGRGWGQGKSNIPARMQIMLK